MEEEKIKDFISEVSQKQATPGAGAVTAVSASMAVATILKAVRFSEVNTLTKKNQELFTKTIEDLEEIRDDFRHLAYKDHESFEVLFEAFKMPKDTAKEKKARDKRVEEGLILTCEVPLQIIDDIRRVQVMVEKIYPLIKHNIISDIGVGLELLQAVAHSSSYNVYSNVRFLKNKARKLAIKTSMETKLSAIDKLNKMINKSIKSIIKN